MTTAICTLLALFSMPGQRFAEDNALRKLHNVPPLAPVHSAVRVGWRRAAPLAGTGTARAFDLPNFLAVARSTALVVLDPKTGHKTWTSKEGDLSWPDWTVQGITDVIQYGAKIFVLQVLANPVAKENAAGLIAFDTNTGKLLLKRSIRGYPEGLIQQADGKLIISIDGHISVFDPANGGEVVDETYMHGWSRNGFTKVFPSLAGKPLCFGQSAYYDGVRVNFGGMPDPPVGTIRAVLDGYTSEVEIEDFAMDFGWLAGLTGIRWLKFSEPLSGTPIDAWNNAYFGYVPKYVRYSGGEGRDRAFTLQVVAVDESGIWTRYFGKGKPERNSLAHIPFKGTPLNLLPNGTVYDTFAVTPSGAVSVHYPYLRIHSPSGKVLKQLPLPRLEESERGLFQFTRHGLVYLKASYSGDIDLTLVAY